MNRPPRLSFLVMIARGQGLTFLVALIVAGCASAPPPPPPLRPAMSLAELCTLPEQRFGSTRDSWKSALGKADAEEIQQIPNRHVEGVVDRRVTLRFGSVEALIHEVPAYDRSFLAQTRISGRDDPRLAIPVRIGDSTATVRQTLGEPVSATPQKLEYLCPSELGATLNIYLDRDRVTKIEWLTEPD